MEEKMKEIPGSFVEDIVKVFLLGIDKELIDSEGNSMPNTIKDPYNFEYQVSWSTLVGLRKEMIRVLRGRKNKKLDLLALAIELVHEDD